MRLCPRPQVGKSTLLSKLCGVRLPSGSDITTRVPLSIRLQRTALGEPAGAGERKTQGW